MNGKAELFDARRNMKMTGYFLFLILYLNINKKQTNCYLDENDEWYRYGPPPLPTNQNKHDEQNYCRLTFGNYIVINLF